MANKELSQRRVDVAPQLGVILAFGVVLAVVGTLSDGGWRYAYLTYGYLTLVACFFFLFEPERIA